MTIKSVDQSKLYLFGPLTHDDTATLIVLERTVRFSYHLEHIIDWVVHISDQRKRGAQGEYW